MFRIMERKVKIIIGITLLVLWSVASSVMAVYFYYKWDNYECKEEPVVELNEVINDEVKEEEKKIVTVKVEIKGEVASPGVYEVSEDTIINDLISLAGGLTENATTNNINLSKKVKNEMVVIIYKKEEVVSNEVITPECNCNDVDISACTDNDASIIISNEEEVTASSEVQNSKININTASIDELTTLPGIGKAKAEAIITYRNQNNGFKTIEDIKNVSGIGDATYEKFKELIMVQ